MCRYGRAVSVSSAGCPARDQCHPHLVAGSGSTVSASVTRPWLRRRMTHLDCLVDCHEEGADEGEGDRDSPLASGE